MIEKKGEQSFEMCYDLRFVLGNRKGHETYLDQSRLQNLLPTMQTLDIRPSIQPQCNLLPAATTKFIDGLTQKGIFLFGPLSHRRSAFARCCNVGGRCHSRQGGGCSRGRKHGRQSWHDDLMMARGSGGSGRMVRGRRSRGFTSAVSPERRWGLGSIGV